MLQKRDISEFKAYLRQCTDRQVAGVYENEAQHSDPDRLCYAELARAEAERRHLSLED